MDYKKLIKPESITNFIFTLGWRSFAVLSIYLISLYTVFNLKGAKIYYHTGEESNPISLWLGVIIITVIYSYIYVRVKKAFYAPDADFKKKRQVLELCFLLGFIYSFSLFINALVSIIVAL